MIHEFKPRCNGNDALSAVLVLYHQQETKEPLPVQKMNALWESCKDDGLLLGKGGLYGTVCYIIISTNTALCIVLPHMHI